jgi:hypothetical protein
MSIISTQHKIKNRTTANDVFITPRPLALEHIEIVKNILENITCDGWEAQAILDPCRNNENGSYYSQLKTSGTFCEPYVDWCEISEGRDFFKYTEGKKYDVIMGNLPFSLTAKWLEHSVKMNAQIISYLMPVYSLTAKRLEMMEAAGYYLENMHQFKWYVCNGMCCFATFIRRGIPSYLPVLDKPDGSFDKRYICNPFTFNRKVWYTIDKWEEKKKRKLEREQKKWKKIYSKAIVKDLTALHREIAYFKNKY